MINVKIETQYCYGEAQKRTKCEFCNAEINFIFHAPFNCKKCFKPFTSVQKLLERRLASSNLTFTVRWHFSNKERTEW